MSLGINNETTQPVTLIESISGATTSKVFTVEENKKATIYSDLVIGAGETIKVQIKKPDGSFVDVYGDDVQLKLTATNNVTAIWGKGIFRITKTSTASPVGVYAYNVNFR